MNNATGRPIIIFVCALSIALMATGGIWGVVETSEARYAEISREMYRSGDWLHPTLLGIYHYHKPPVTYWLTATAYSIFGVNPFATRFFLVVAFCVQLVVVYRIARYVFKEESISYYSTLVYSTLPLVLVSVRGLTTDAYLNTFILLSIYSWIKFTDTKKEIFLYATAAALGLGFMTKGPVVFVFPLLVVVSLWKMIGRPRVTVAGVVISVCIFAVVGLSWFAFLIREDPRMADYFFFRHFVDRIVHAEVFARRQPWYYYLAFVPLITLPWLVLFIKGLLKKEPILEMRKLIRYLLLWWFVLPLAFFSFSSSKLVLYVLPLSIGFSLITGYLLSRQVPRAFSLYFQGFACLLCVGMITIPLHSPQFSASIWLLLIPMIALFLIFMQWIRKTPPGMAVVLSSMIYTLALVSFAAPFMRANATAVNAITDVSSFIQRNNLATRSVAVYDELLPSLAFGLEKEIICLYNGNRSLEREVQFQKDDSWKRSLIDVADTSRSDVVRSQFSSDVVLVTKKELPESLRTWMVGEWHEERFGKWIIFYK